MVVDDTVDVVIDALVIVTEVTEVTVDAVAMELVVVLKLMEVIDEV